MLVDAQLPFPSLAAPLASGSLLGHPSTAQLGRAGGWGQGAAWHPQRHQSHPIRAGAGIRDQPDSQLGVPCSQLLDQGIRSFQLPWGVQTLQEEGLDGAGIFSEQGSDLSWSVLLDPSCVILLLQVQLEEWEFPVLLDLAPSPGQENRRASLLCPG